MGSPVCKRHENASALELINALQGAAVTFIHRRWLAPLCATVRGADVVKVDEAVDARLASVNPPLRQNEMQFAILGEQRHGPAPVLLGEICHHLGLGPC